MILHVDLWSTVAASAVVLAAGVAVDGITEGVLRRRRAGERANRRTSLSATSELVAARPSEPGLRDLITVDDVLVGEPHVEPHDEHKRSMHPAGYLADSWGNAVTRINALTNASLRENAFLVAAESARATMDALDEVDRRARQRGGDDER